MVRALDLAHRMIRITVNNYGLRLHGSTRVGCGDGFSAATTWDVVAFRQVISHQGQKPWWERSKTVQTGQPTGGLPGLDRSQRAQIKRSNPGNQTLVARVVPF